MRVFFLSVASTVFLFSCNTKQNESVRVIPEAAPQNKPEPRPAERKAPEYYLLTSKDSIKKMLKNADTAVIALIALLNRADKNRLRNFDTIVVPADTKQEISYYFPFPASAEFLKDVNKIIFFSYPTQAFAAYEHGKLVFTGPTSMGRKANKTPTGLFYTNWKAAETISTVNDEWILKWNFNIQNKMGIGFHQYVLPGYPASHSCLRLSEKDAMLLYDWAQQWKLSGSDNILAHGTPVIVYGSYPFGSARPWLALANNGDALLISETELENIAKQYIPDIMRKQAERDSL